MNRKKQKEATEEKEKLGKVIFNARKNLRNMSQEELAKAVGTSKGHISLLEKGKTNICLDRLKLIAVALECNLPDSFLIDAKTNLPVTPAEPKKKKS